MSNARQDGQQRETSIRATAPMPVRIDFLRHVARVRTIARII
jgi:hypothetical protein